MSGGAMFYALDLDALGVKFAARTISPDDLIAYLEAHAHALANTAHMPAPFNMLLDLDEVLAASGYPPRFCYKYLFNDPMSLRMEPADDLPLVGAAPADLVTIVADRARVEAAPHVTDDWQARALEELFHNVIAAADLQFGLVGVYT